MKAVAVAALIVLAGCLSSQDGDAREPTIVPATPIDLPPGCDGREPVHHKAGAVPADGPRVFGCFHRLGAPSFEPSIGIDSGGAVYYYPASGPGLPSTVQMARSSDEGASWDILTPNLAGVPTHPYSQDPLLYLDPTTDRIFAEDLLLVPPTCGMMSLSDDGGETWTHAQAGCMQTDHVSLFTGPPATSPTLGYPNVVYRCAISGGALAGTSTQVTCQRSIDGGMTWLPPGTSPWTFLPAASGLTGACDGGNGHGVVGPDGTVFLPRGHCGRPELAISTDEALTWTVVQVSDLGNACGGGLCEHDAGVGIDTAGTVYYAWVAADGLPYVARSFDRGSTWDEPMMLAPPGVNEAGLIQMAVGGKGELAFAYLATTTGPGDVAGDHSDTFWGAYMTIAQDADADPTFTTLVLNETGEPVIRGRCGPLRCGAVFDFIDIRIGPDGTPWAPFVDGCLTGCREGPDDGSEAVTGRVWGIDLWDETDPNGPYP